MIAIEVAVGAAENRAGGRDGEQAAHGDVGRNLVWGRFWSTQQGHADGDLPGGGDDCRETGPEVRTKPPAPQICPAATAPQGSRYRCTDAYVAKNIMSDRDVATLLVGRGGSPGLQAALRLTGLCPGQPLYPEPRMVDC